MTITRPVTAPNDLRVAGAVPRKQSPSWRQGDIVHVDRVRWIIRVLTGSHVELEALNARCGIWWTTTLDKLPAKVSS